MKRRRTFSLILLIALAFMQLQCARKITSIDSIVEPLATETMQYIPTFQVKSCDRINLQYFNKMSDQRDGVIPMEAVIIDKENISKVLSLMKELPDEGDIMVKMGDVAILNVILTDGFHSVYFRYYLKQIKTPATSFYSNHPKEEKILYYVLMSHIKK